jgi:kynurenine formamidase
MPILIDLTHRVENGIPVYPGDLGVRLTADSIHGTASDGCPMAHVGRVNMGLHNGTHMDAPFHFLPHGFTIEKTPLERCVGKAVLVHLPHLAPRQEICPGHLASREQELKTSRKLVLRTDWSKRWREANYFTAHPFVGTEAARWLLERGVNLIALDFPSVDHPPYETHLIWLEAGATLVENLTNLDQISSSSFTLIALPLPIVGMDGSPVRAVAMVDEPGTIG